MKIVKLTANFYPRKCGVGDYTRTLCETLVKVNRDISFYIFTSADKEIEESGYAFDRIKVIPAITSWTSKGLKELRKRIREISPEIVHIEYNRALYKGSLGINFLPYHLKRENPRLKVVVTFHDAPSPVRGRDPLFWLTSFLVLAFSDKIILTNDVDFNNLIFRSFLIKKKLTLIPVGSNIPKIESDRSNTRRSLGVSENEIIIVFFGFIREDKSLTLLFRAFSELLTDRDALRLLLIGGVLSKEIFVSSKELGEKLKIADKLIWTEYQPDKRVSELLTASDIAVLPYRFGLKLNSGAFAACVLHELPIISTKAKFMPEIIKDGYNLLLVAPERRNELKQALSRLINDPSLRMRLSLNLKELKRDISWQRISEEILQVYLGLLKR